MNKGMKAFSGQVGANYYGLIICAALFICGCIAGVASAGHVDGVNLSGYMADYLGSGGGHVARSGFWDSLLNACKYHLLAVFFGFSLLGVVCAPVLAAVRGFFLCFAISVVVRLYGGNGVLLALSLFGADALMTIPCFFVLSVQSFTASMLVLKTIASGARAGVSPYGNGFFRRCIICAAVLTCAAAFDVLIAPQLIDYVASRI